MPDLLSAAGAAWRRSTPELSLSLLLGCALLGLAWLLPGHYLPWSMFQQETCAAAACLLLCLATAQAKVEVRWPTLAWAATLCALVPWAQFAFGQIRFLDDAVLTSAYLLAMGLSICVGASLATSRLRTQFVEGLTASFVAAATLSTGIALYQWLGLPPVDDWMTEMPPWGRPYANFGQPNHLSSLLAMGIAGVLRLYETRRIGAFAGVVGTAWMFWGIAMTQSRTGWVFLAILGAGLLLLRHRAQLRTPRLAVVAAVFAFAAMVMLQAPLKTLWNLEAGGVAPPVVRTEAGTRFLHWQMLTDAVLHAPWFGYGWNQVSHAQYDFVLQHPATGEYVVQSHNLVLDLLLYNGMPLGGLLVAGLLVWICRTLRLCRDGSTWCLLAALLALVAHALLEYPLHYAYFLLPAGLLIGILHTAEPSGTWASPTAARPTLWVPALLMSLLLIWIGVEYMRAEEALRRLRFATARIGITFADLRSPDLTLIQGWKAYHDAALIKPTRGMPAQELAQLRDVARRYSYAPALLRYARALAMNGQPVEAHRVLARVCKTYPPHIQSSIEETWHGHQATDSELASVEFPKCAS